MATKEEWREYFKAVEGREPSVKEFLEAKQAREFWDEGTKKVLTKRNLSSKSFKRKKRPKRLWFLIATFFLFLAGGLGGYFAYQKFFTPAQSLKNSVFVYKGKLVNASKLSGVESDFSSIESQDTVKEGLYFVQGTLKKGTDPIGALINATGETLDKSLTVKNASVENHQLRAMTEAKAGDGKSSIQSIFYSKKEAAYYASKTSFNQGVIELSQTAMDAILKHRPAGSFIVLNDKYYMDEADAILSFREIKTGKALYNSKNNPEFFAPNSYLFSNRYMMAQPKKVGKNYVYKVYDGQNLKKYLFELTLPQTLESGKLEGEWTSDGYSFVIGEKDKDGNYSSASIVDMKQQKVSALKLDLGDLLQIMGNYILRISKNEKIKIYSENAKEVRMNTINPAQAAKTNGKISTKEGQIYNAAFAAVEKAEKAEADAEDKLGKTKADSQTMNLEQIAQGDYSSIQGTWKDGEGIVLTVKNNTISNSDHGEQRYVINGLSISIPTRGKTWRTLPLIAKMENGVLNLSFNDGGSLAGGGVGQISFVAIGVTSWPSATWGYSEDRTKERIISAEITHFQENRDYGAYKVGGNAGIATATTISSADQAAIDAAVKAAQSALDQLKAYSWAQEDLAGLQARLNKVSGRTSYELLTGMNLEEIKKGNLGSLAGTYRAEESSGSKFDRFTISADGKLTRDDGWTDDLSALTWSYGTNNSFLTAGKPSLNDSVMYTLVPSGSLVYNDPPSNVDRILISGGVGEMYDKEN